MAAEPRYVGTSELPWEEGLLRGRDVTDDVDPASRKARWSLTGMAKDHKFYFADLLKITGVVADPINIFWAENGLPLQEAPYEIVLDREILRGLPAPLDRTIYACPNHHAKRLFEFLDRFAAGDPRGIYWESIHQRMKLVDWPLVSSLTIMPEAPPFVEIELYGLSGPSAFLHWKPPQDPWRDPLCLVRTNKKLPPLPKPGQKLKPRRRPFS